MFLCVIMCVSLFLFKQKATMLCLVWFFWLQSRIKRIGFHVEHGIFSPMNHFNHFVDSKVIINLVLEVVRIKNFDPWNSQFPNRFWKLKILNRISLYRTNFGGSKLSDRNWLMWSRIFGYRDHLRIWSISGLHLVFHLKIMCSFVVCDSSSCYAQLDLHVLLLEIHELCLRFLPCIPWFCIRNYLHYAEGIYIYIYI
jgi:hypothetical protein